MLRKKYFTFFLTFALFSMSGIAIFAQTAPLRGKVMLNKADGTTVPVADATIDVFRIDVKGKFPSGKTNKNGEFSFAGLPLGAKMAIAVSAPNIKPDVRSDIAAGNDNISITVTEGDGKRLTEEEVRQVLTAIVPASNQTVALTAEQKKAQEEYQKQVADIEQKNKKVENSNKIINAALQEGNKAFESKNYDLAINKFDEGINAEPDFVGTAPVLLNNKAVALINRATITYNQSVKADAEAKTAAMAKVKKDFEDAANASNRALEILKAAPAAEANVQKGYDANRLQAIVNRKEAYRLMVKTGADRTKGKETLAAFQEYIPMETDEKKKADAQLALAEALQDSSEFDLAITEFERVLAVNPDNIEALAGAGFSLVNVGYLNNDKTKLQQGANYLQKFAELAPDTHKYKDDAKGLIETLKKEQSVTPQKVTKGSSTKKKQ